MGSYGCAFTVVTNNTNRKRKRVDFLFISRKFKYLFINIFSKKIM
jgi:hypothetical protein